MTRQDHILTPESQALLLLVGRFTRRGGEHGSEPLRLSEYNELARWLAGNGVSPGDLHEDETIRRLRGGNLTAALVDRIERLMDRGAALAVALEQWTSTGMWVLGRTDKEYPRRLRERLRASAPVILYGFGERQLFGRPSVGIVGSRRADADTLDFVRRLGRLAAAEGMAVVSGGARGVDREAMQAALESAGRAIGVLAADLRKMSMSGDRREFIEEGKLLLVSPYAPDTPFSVGAAMGRNKLIYCLSDRAVVGNADAEKGGTWAGAIENLKRGWVPLHVRASASTTAGNKRLIGAGGIPIDERASDEELSAILRAPVTAPMTGVRERPVGERQLALLGAAAAPVEAGEVTGSAETEVEPERKPVECPESLLHSVWPVLRSRMDGPCAASDLADRCDVGRVQIEKWLEAAVRLGWAKRLARPKRYAAMGEAIDAGAAPTGGTVFEAAWPHLRQQLREPAAAAAVAAELEVSRIEMTRWLAEAVARGWLRKAGRPARYALADQERGRDTGQLPLLGRG